MTEDKKEPSVLKGETPFMTFNVHADDGKKYPVGNLWCKGGVFTFDGSVDLSAKVFFEHCCTLLTSTLQRELKG